MIELRVHGVSRDGCPINSAWVALRFNRRYVALKLAYLGWDYHGLAIQDTVENTIEVGHEARHSFIFVPTCSPSLPSRDDCLNVC